MVSQGGNGIASFRNSLLSLNSASQGDTQNQTEKKEDQHLNFRFKFGTKLAASLITCTDFCCVGFLCSKSPHSQWLIALPFDQFMVLQSEMAAIELIRRCCQDSISFDISRVKEEFIFIPTFKGYPHSLACLPLCPKHMILDQGLILLFLGSSPSVTLFPHQGSTL